MDKAIDGQRPRDRAGRAGQTVEFDDLRSEQALAFYPEKPAVTDNQRWLWWTGAFTPESIDEVICLLNERQGLVDTIVIGGLGGYPLSMNQWTQWLLKWSQRCKNTRLVVDTRGLSPKRRRRLMAMTRRRLQLTPGDDPVSRTVGRLKVWLQERI